MAGTPQEDLSILQAKIEQQQNTVAALKRDGHECADAERQLALMLTELERVERTAARVLPHR